MDAQRLTTEGASRPLSVPAGSYLDGERTRFLPAFASGGPKLAFALRPRGRNVNLAGPPAHRLRRALERGNLLIADATATVRCAMTLADLAARGPSLPGRSYRPVIHKAWYPRGTKPQV